MGLDLDYLDKIRLLNFTQTQVFLDGYYIQMTG